jgi:hypothetical protein
LTAALVRESCILSLLLGFDWCPKPQQTPQLTSSEWRMLTSCCTTIVIAAQLLLQ